MLNNGRVLFPMEFSLAERCTHSLYQSPQASEYLSKSFKAFGELLRSTSGSNEATRLIYCALSLWAFLADHFSCWPSDHKTWTCLAILALTLFICEYYRFQIAIEAAKPSLQNMKLRQEIWRENMNEIRLLHEAERRTSPLTTIRPCVCSANTTFGDNRNSGQLAERASESPRQDTGGDNSGLESEIANFREARTPKEPANTRVRGQGQPKWKVGRLGDSLRRVNHRS